MIWPTRTEANRIVYLKKKAQKQGTSFPGDAAGGLCGVAFTLVFRSAVNYNEGRGESGEKGSLRAPYASEGGRTMLKVFLAEDERLVREGLRDMIPWEQVGYVFAGEASDGEMALPLVRKISLPSMAKEKEIFGKPKARCSTVSMME